MRKVAACRVYYSVHEFSSSQIIEIVNSKVVAIRDMIGEEAMTEWMLGSIVLSNIHDLNINDIDNVAYFYPHQGLNKSIDIFAWHVGNIELKTGNIGDRNITLIK